MSRNILAVVLVAVIGSAAGCSTTTGAVAGDQVMSDEMAKRVAAGQTLYATRTADGRWFVGEVRTDIAQAASTGAAPAEIQRLYSRLWNGRFNPDTCEALVGRTVSEAELADALAAVPANRKAGRLTLVITNADGEADVAAFRKAASGKVRVEVWDLYAARQDAYNPVQGNL